MSLMIVITQRYRQAGRLTPKATYGVRLLSVLKGLNELLKIKEAANGLEKVKSYNCISIR